MSIQEDRKVDSSLSIGSKSPRHTHFDSYELLRSLLDASRIPHFARYGQRDNVLVIVNGIEYPVCTRRASLIAVQDSLDNDEAPFSNSSLAMPYTPVLTPHSLKYKHSAYFAVDPVMAIVELHRLVDVTYTEAMPEYGMSRTYTKTRWMAFELLPGNFHLV